MAEQATDEFRELLRQIQRELREGFGRIQALEEGLRQTNATLGEGLRRTDAKIDDVGRHVQLLAEAQSSSSDRLERVELKVDKLGDRADQSDLRLNSIEKRLGHSEVRLGSIETLLRNGHDLKAPTRKPTTHKSATRKPATRKRRR